MTTTRPDSVFKIFPFLFQLYNFNTNEDQALINKKLPKELILRYYFLKLNKVSGRSTSKLRSTKKNYSSLLVRLEKFDIDRKCGFCVFYT